MLLCQGKAASLSFWLEIFVCQAKKNWRFFLVTVHVGRGHKNSVLNTYNNGENIEIEKS